MDYTSAANLVMATLKKTHRVNFKQFHWTFITKGGNETVEFISDKNESKYVYTRVRKFLGFTLGEEQVHLSSNDDEMDMVLWFQIGDIMHNTISRFGVNA